jgi:hypothetical protein
MNGEKDVERRTCCCKPELPGVAKTRLELTLASEVDDFADVCGAVVPKLMRMIITFGRTGCCFQQNGAPPPQSSVRSPAYTQ